MTRIRSKWYRRRGVIWIYTRNRMITIELGAQVHWRNWAIGAGLNEDLDAGQQTFAQLGPLEVRITHGG